MPAGRRTTTLYFAAEKSPVGEPILVLDGDDAGPVNHLMVMSDIAPGYAPAGASLVSVSVPDARGDTPDALIDAVRSQLRGWYGDDVAAWRHLRTYRIPYALPDRWSRPTGERLPPGLSVCGDWCETPSIQGALRSGRRTAERLLAPEPVAR